MLCQFEIKINPQNEDFWRLSLEECYDRIVELFSSRKIKFFMPSSERISAPGSYILYGGYKRVKVIDIQQVQKDDGSWVFEEVVIKDFRVQRILDKETGRTQAILNNFFIPYKQYSLRYVLYYLLQFYDQHTSQEKFCLEMDPERTFRTWLKWLRDHIMVLRELGLVKQYEDNWNTMRQWVSEIAGDLPGWIAKSLQRLNLFLFQDHSMPENTMYQKYLPDG